MDIVGVGGPKGGKSASTQAVHLAAIASRAGLSVLLVDGDENRSATDIVEGSGDLIRVDLADGQDPAALRRLRQLRSGHDLVVVDLPGAKQGPFSAILSGDGRPVVDLLVMPCAPEAMELRPTLRSVRGEIADMRLPYLLVFTRVDTVSMEIAEARREELRQAGMKVSDTIIRRYRVYNDAAQDCCTVLDIPGRRSYARQAEKDQRAFADEVFDLLGLKLRRTGRTEI
jgi:chromosome partitioning protein